MPPVINHKRPFITYNIQLRIISLTLWFNWQTISKTKAMRKVLLLSILAAALVILPGHAFSQTRMKLSGIVSDSTKPLSLVTVRIFKKINQPPLQTTLTKENGGFQFNKPDTGNYILSFTHTGYEEKHINITITAQASDMQVETVQLSRATGVLKK
jgi:hypothetical protein